MEQRGEITFLTNHSLSLIPQEDRAKFELLCLNGVRAPLGAAANCHWLALPTPTLVVSGSL